jgi:hypothetical protein
MGRSTLLVVGASLIVFLVTGMAVFALAAKSNTLDNECRQFVSAAVPAIFSEWNEKELVARASAELKTAVNHRELRQVFGGMAQKFGKLQNWKAEGETSISMNSDRAILITGEYVAKSRFAAGEADIILSLVRDKGQWHILSFRLNSEMF